jgi:hypothetical protein
VGQGAPRIQPKERRETQVSRLRAVLERDGDYVIVTDLDAAVFLHAIKGLSIANAEKVGRSMHVITIYDPEHLAEGLVIEFINSEACRFANGMRSVKKILHRFGGKGRR